MMTTSDPDHTALWRLLGKQKVLDAVRVRHDQEHRQASSPCLLHHLENPHLSGLTIGLDMAEGVRLQPDFFLCCQGSGIRWQPLKQAYSNCQVAKRLRRVREWQAQYHSIWSDRPWALPSTKQSQSVLKDLAMMIKGQAPQALIIKGKKNAPGIVWSMALALVWRFGCQVFIESFARKGASFRLPNPLERGRDQPGPQIVMIEQFQRASDAHDRHHLEALINYSYNTNAFLILEHCPTQEFSRQARAGSQAERTLQQFETMVQNAASKHSEWDVFDRFLEPDSSSQLYSMCHLPIMTLPVRS